MANILDPPAGPLENELFTRELRRLTALAHALFIYEKPSEWRSFIGSFLRIGIENRDKCLYIYDTHTSRQVRDAFRESGIQPNVIESSGQLTIVHGSKIYLKSGSFNPEEMISYLINETEKALAEGYHGLRVTGETEWVIQGLPGSGRILDYESGLNLDNFRQLPCLNICQYDRTRFDPAVIRNLVMAHPVIIRNFRVVNNAYYIPPDIFLSPKRAELESQFLFQSIEREDNRERELQDTADKLQVLFKEATTIILVTDQAGHYINANEAGLQFLECTRQELAELSVWDTILPDDLTKWQEQTSEKTTSRILEVDHLINGKTKTLLMNVMVTGSGGKKEIYGIGQDVTHHIQVEKKLTETEERFRQLYATMYEGVAIHEIIYDGNETAVDYIITDVNPAYEQILGLNKEQAVNKKASELYSSGQPPYIEKYARVAESGHPDLFEVFFAPMNKYFRILVFCPEKGKFVTVFSDITSSKNLESRNSLLASVVHSTDDAIFSLDTSGIITSWNRGAEIITGYSEAEVNGRSLTFLIPTERQPEIQLLLAAVARGEMPDHFETIGLKKNGRTFIASLTVSPIKDNSGQLTGFSAIARDITVQKNTGDALIKSEERLRLAQSAARVGTWEWEILSNRNTWSDEAWKLYNLDPQNVEPSYDNWKAAILPADRESSTRAVAEAVKNEQDINIEWRVNAPGNSVRWLLSRGQPVKDETGRVVRYIGIVMDITARKEAEETSRYNEVKFRAIFEQSRDALLLINQQGLVIGWNQSCEQLTGYRRDEVLGQPAWDIQSKLTAPDKKHLFTPEAIKASLLKSLDSHQPFYVDQSRDYSLMRSDARIVAVDVVMFLIETEHEFMICSQMRDITQKKQHEEQIRYQARLVEQVSDAVISVDMDSNIKSWNKAAETIYGWKTEEVMNQPVTGITRTEFPGIASDRFPEILTREGFWQGETIEKHRDGGVIYMLSSVSLIKNETGQLIGIVTINKDITERKKNEKIIVESEERFRKIFEESTLGMVLSNADYRFFKVNQAMCNMLGFSEQELLRLTFKEITHPDHLETDSANIQKLYNGTISNYRTQKRYLTKSGAVIWGEINLTAVRDEKGAFLYYLAAVENITTRKLAELELKESERKFRELAELLPEMVFETDIRGRLTFVNKVAFDIFGYSPIEKQNTIILDSLVAEDRPRAQADLNKVLADQIPCTSEYTALRSDGSRFPVLISSSAIKNNAGDVLGVRGILIDITARKKTEEKIQLNEARLESLLRIAQYTPVEKQDLLDYALEEAIKLTKSQLGYIYYYYEDRRLFVLNTWSKEVMPACRVQNPETVYHLDKTGLWGEAVRQRKPIVVNDFSAAGPLKKGYPQGHAELFRFMTIPVIAGKHIVAVVGVANKKTDYDQSDVRQLTLLMDSTWKLVERVQAEADLKQAAEKLEKSYQKELKQRQELEAEAKARGMFIDVLAHELRTPLTPILISTGLLRDLSREPIQGRLVANIYGSANTLAHRLEELLEVARYSRGTFKLRVQPVAMRAFIEGVLTRIRPVFEERNQQLVTEIADELPVALVDPSRLEQVLANLLSNAAKFTQERGTVLFKAGVVSEGLLVEVSDNGIGITIEEQSRLFQPYHRVEQDRQQFNGIGLGLAVVKQIIEAHGGRVWLQSQPGLGSTFSFVIPLGTTLAN